MSEPPSGAVLARVDDLNDPCAVIVYAGDTPLILTRQGEHIAAFRNKCPHAGYPLQRHDGRIVVQEGRYMVCGAHGASFALTDGACAGGPCNGDGLTPIAILISDGEVRLA